jgi:hypothetical protein
LFFQNNLQFIKKKLIRLISLIDTDQRKNLVLKINLLSGDIRPAFQIGNIYFF